MLIAPSSLPLLALALAPQATPAPALPERVMAAIDPERLLGDVERLAFFGTRHTLSSTASDEFGIGAARRWILAEFDTIAARAPRLEAYLDPHEVDSRGSKVEVVNVVGILPGTMPEAAGRRYYVLGHYDSRASNGRDAESEAPGANDDGSGTALVMELARVLAEEELDSTVVFLATAGEELGLWGARAHVDAAIAEGLDVRGALNNDIIGDPTGPPLASGEAREARDRIRVFSEGIPNDADESELRTIRRLSSEADSNSRQLARFVADVAARHGTAVQPMLVYRPDRFLRGGDQTAFLDHGIAAVRFTEVYENYHRQHQDVREEDGVQYGDLPEYVDGEYLADVARLNAAALIHLANAPSIPGNVRTIVSGLSHDTTLVWDASPEPDVAGYEVLWRETTSPQWDHVLDVGEEREATLELSKDNWFFGVRAYDAEGYRSPVAFSGIGRR